MADKGSCSDVLLRLTELCKSYDNESILKNVNLYIKDKAFVTLLGPSGCGKTTILRLIGGFESPDSGDIIFGDTRINDVPPHKREINTVFQRYALFPHLNVFENVAFGLRIKKLPEDEITQKVKKMLAMVDLKGYEKRPVSKLSGGQQQRVAIARALVNMPRLLLLDEPLGALDLKLRKDMQLELKNIQKQANITFLYVTHDQEEALTMSDVIVVMKSGTIQQIGTPEDIYNEPANAFVADFVGEANIVDGVMENDFSVTLCGAELKCVDKKPSDRNIVDVVVRPEDVEIVPAGEGFVDGVVESSLFKGVHYEMTVNVGGAIWLIHSTVSATVGDTIGMRVAPDNVHIMEKMYSSAINTFVCRIESADSENSLYGIKLEGCSYQFSSPLVFNEGDSVKLSIPAEAIEVVAADEGDFDAYLDSIIWKADHYELILEGDEGRFLTNKTNDEQAGTDVGLKLNVEKCIIEPCPESEGEDK
ncbi:MAG: ABC transporter ATP-binding protein [Ruminococcaceae bacterium]|nr:ABC transporter ATP-binding protein [Oscillospiraceae bacterium]